MPMAAEGGGGGGYAPPAAPPVPSDPGTAATSQAIIPDAGVYGAESAAAVNAYNNAIATALAQRNALYNQYGLLNDGSVDPNNPQGSYQQMLRAQADQYAADEQNAQARNLGGRGLGAQQESHDVADSQAQDFQMQQQIAKIASDYADSLTSAGNTRDSSIAQAYTDAMNTALQNALANITSGNYTAPGTQTAQTQKPAPTDKAPKPKPPVAKPKKIVDHHHSRG